MRGALPARGALPPPLRGRVGEGGPEVMRKRRRNRETLRPPPLTPPRRGEGNAASEGQAAGDRNAPREGNAPRDGNAPGSRHAIRLSSPHWIRPRSSPAYSPARP